MKNFPVTERHRNLKRDLDKLMKKHSPRLTDQEIIGIVAQHLGIIGGLCHDILTRDEFFQVVTENINVTYDRVKRTQLQ